MTLWVFPIKPLFARQIYSGVKKYELRRRVKVKPGNIIVLYETAPVKAITGEFVAGSVRLEKAEAVKAEVLRGLIPGCDERDLPYIGERGEVAIIEVLSPKRYRYPLTLSELERVISKQRLRGAFRATRYPELVRLLERARRA